MAQVVVVVGDIQGLIRCINGDCGINLRVKCEIWQDLRKLYRLVEEARMEERRGACSVCPRPAACRIAILISKRKQLSGRHAVATYKDVHRGIGDVDDTNHIVVRAVGHEKHRVASS